jgi:YesN/AraC family two-component response regulator
LLSFNVSTKHKTYGYRFIKGPQFPPAQLYSLGWQIQSSSDYYYDGMKRQDEAGNCVFQYTLSGSGMIEFNDQHFILNKGTAFISVIPSNHRYYIPENSEKWEFIFITLTGDYVISEWIKIQEQFGKVIHFKEKEEIIQYIWEIYLAAINNNISDGYQTSTIAYEFIMKLYRSLNLQLMDGNSNNCNINKSIHFMKDNLHRELSLDDMADVVNMSKYYFNHTFTKTVGISPWNYLTKLRVEYAITLLLTTTFTVDEISCKVGYASANYFNKVFRKYIGTSPGKFRKRYTDVNDFTINL